MDKTDITRLGDYVKEEDILYDPLTDTYRIKAEGRTTEIQSQALRSENAKALREATARIGEADGKVACMDTPEARPDRNPKEQAKVYYHDRYPSMPIRSIVGDAIDMLNRNKKLRISEFDLRVDGIDGGEVSLVLAANRVTEPWLRKVLEVTFPQKAFERFGHDVDRCAGLKAKLDTNAYIKLRIAFLLYQAIKLNDRDAERINLDIFRVFASDTGPDFAF